MMSGGEWWGQKADGCVLRSTSGKQGKNLIYRRYLEEGWAQTWAGLGGESTARQFMLEKPKFAC